MRPRTALALTLSVLLVVGWALAPKLFGPRARTLVENGGFQGPTFQGWDHNEGSTVIVETGAGHPPGGNRLVSSDVDGTLRLAQHDRPVRKGVTYRFDVRLRAQGAPDVVLTTWERTPKDSSRAAVWTAIPEDWSRFSAYVTPARDGKLSFELKSEPRAGVETLVRVDDVSMTEVRLAVATQVEPRLGFDDEPSMARGADGTYFAAWVSWRDGGDTLQLARYRLSGDGKFALVSAIQLLGGGDLTVSEPNVTIEDDVAFVVCSLERDGRRDVESIAVGPKGPGELIRVSVDDEVPANRSPVCLWHEGRLHVAWSTSPVAGLDLGTGGVVERNGGIAVAALDGDRSRSSSWMAVPDERQRSCPGAPSLAIAADGTRTVAFHAIVDGNSDVFVAARDGTSSPLPPRRVTHAPTVDRNPVLLTRGRETWLLYENVETPGYRVNEETARHVVVAKIDGDELLAPKNYAATSPLWDHAESPAAVFDAKGRLWVVYRRPRPPTAGWDVFLTGWTGDAWVPPIPVSTMKGMNGTPSLALDGIRAIVCFQADDLPQSWGEIDRNADAKSGIHLVAIDLPDVSASTHELEPLVENPAKWEAADIRKRFGDDEPTKHETEVGDETLTLLFGDLHSHSDTSVCDRLQNGSADDVYAMQRDFLHLDFACLTDHAEDMNPYLWNRQAKLARANDVPGKFTTFLGFEWTSGYDGTKPEGWFGHRNVILGDLRFPRWWSPRDHQTPAQLWAELRAANANFVTIPHQLADTGNVPTDWNYTDETAQPVAEVFQVRGSYEAKDAPRVGRKATAHDDHFLQGALKQGIVVGVIASPDHGGGLGKACVWATENSREAILDALRARRCYGTTGARITLEFRVGGHFMGERTMERAAAGTVPIHVRMRCPGKVAKVSLCRNGAWIKTWEPGKDGEIEITATDEAPAGPKWYYVRIEQEDGELAWSSPVWLGAGK